MAGNSLLESKYINSYQDINSKRGKEFPVMIAYLRFCKFEKVRIL